MEFKDRIYWNLNTYGKAVKIKKNYLKGFLTFLCIVTPGTNWMIPFFSKIIKNDILLRY